MTDIPELITAITTEWPHTTKYTDEILKIHQDQTNLIEELRNGLAEALSGHFDALESILTLQSQCKRYELIIDKLLQDD